MFQQRGFRSEYLKIGYDINVHISSAVRYLLGPFLFGFRRKTIRLCTSGSVDYSGFHNTVEHREGFVGFSCSLHFIEEDGFLLLAGRREVLVVLLEYIVGFDNARAAGASIIRHDQRCLFVCLVL